MAGGMDVRLLGKADLIHVPDVLGPEGWDFTVPELERLHRLGGLVGAWDGDRLVGVLTYVDEPPLRWIGNVAVRQDQRGRGLGARIMAKAMEGAPRVGLYAVEKAVTLYERAGLVAHGDAYSYRATAARAARPTTAQRMTRDDLLDVARYDRQETTLDRGYLLRELLSAYPDSARVVRERGLVVGYGIAKTYAGVTEIGPLVASAPRVAEDLLDALLTDTRAPHECMVLGANRHAIGALEKRGFERAFRAVPMYRGPPPAWRVGAIAATGAPEKG